MTRSSNSAAARFQLDVKGFDVLHQQVLLNSQAKVSAYDLIPVDLPQFGEYRDILMDLTPLIKEINYDPSDFQKAAWEARSRVGCSWSCGPASEIFAYRKDIFQKYGLKPPETTDEMLDAAKKTATPSRAWPACAGTASAAPRLAKPLSRFSVATASRRSTSLRRATTTSTSATSKPRTCTRYSTQKKSR